jgi:hypothetical protein
MAERKTDREAADGVTAARLADAVADPRFAELHRLSKEIAGILDALAAAAHHGDVQATTAQEVAYLSRSLLRQRVLIAELGLDGPVADG